MLSALEVCRINNSRAFNIYNELSTSRRVTERDCIRQRLGRQRQTLPRIRIEINSKPIDARKRKIVTESGARAELAIFRWRFKHKLWWLDEDVYKHCKFKFEAVDVEKMLKIYPQIYAIESHKIALNFLHRFTIRLRKYFMFQNAIAFVTISITSSILRSDCRYLKMFI